MEFDLSLMISIGGIVASVASAMAITKTKVAAMETIVSEQEKRFDALRSDVQEYKSGENIRIALLERNQEAHSKELEELKSDIKTIMANVQDIKEVVLKIKKG